MLNNLLQMHLKLFLEEQEKIQKTAAKIGNKITDKITKVSKISPQNNSEIVTNEKENIGLDREILTEKYILHKKDRQLLIDDIRLI